MASKPPAPAVGFAPKDAMQLVVELDAEDLSEFMLSNEDLSAVLLPAEDLTAFMLSDEDLTRLMPDDDLTGLMPPSNHSPRGGCHLPAPTPAGDTPQGRASFRRKIKS